MLLVFLSVLRPSRVPSYGGGGWPNRHITFIVAEKAQFTVPLALFTVYMGERKLVENVIWGGEVG